MAKTVKEVMTPSPRIFSKSATVEEAARAMREDSIGDVLVMDDDQRLCGIVTDRDIVVRVIAEDRNPATTTLDEICTRELATLQPTASIGDAVKLMVERAIRRVPVMQEGSNEPLGVVTLGDLARAQDPSSALGAISSAPPN